MTPRGRTRRGGLLRRAAPFVVFSLAGLALGRRLSRVEVRGRSMEPLLHDGDWLLAWRGGRPGAGTVVIARDPRDPSRTVVKRLVGWVPGGAWLEGDNPAASTDSRVFGAVAPGEIAGRVVVRYWPHPRLIR